MRSLRAFVFGHRYAVALLIAAALCVRIFVPAGFMPTADNGRIVVGICNSAGGTSMVIEIPGLEHKQSGQPQQGCAFSDLSLSPIGGADPIQLAALIAFVLALGIVFAIAFPPQAAYRLRPPLRGPPHIASLNL